MKHDAVPGLTVSGIQEKKFDFRHQTPKILESEINCSRFLRSRRLDSSHNFLVDFASKANIHLPTSVALDRDRFTFPSMRRDL
ncbi:MAG: hypothetical protein IPK68_07235 [Bdellovibrionales bacterium]|nr:hypothetical protein [Bdellovibrionales bacterium]